MLVLTAKNIDMQLDEKLNFNKYIHEKNAKANKVIQGLFLVHFWYHITVIEIQSWIEFFIWIFMEKSFFDPTTSSNVLFYHLIKPWILHIACMSPASWLKIFVLLKFCDYATLNSVGGEWNWSLQCPLTQTSSCIFGHMAH